MALTSSPEEPLAVRTVARSLGEWIGRLGQVWVEGEVAQISRRPGANFVFLTLRDTQAQMSLSLTCGAGVLDAVVPPLSDGARVVVLGKPSFYTGRGTVSLAVSQIRPVGLGELLARLELLKQLLAAEGLFAADRKRPLPFLPRAVGLITGRGGAAEHDVLENARLRWPAVRFVIRNTAVQGAAAVPEIIKALNELQDEPDVDVIVIARGGGSVEDLLPFSDETLLRAVAGTKVPIVSAIGHEQDSPLLDLVADLRASTPTDAARRVVPDIAHELQGIDRARTASRAALERRLDREGTWLAALRARPVMASPSAFLAARHDDLADRRRRMRSQLAGSIARAKVDLAHQRSTVRLLSPASTLERGYAIVRTSGTAAAGHVVRSTSDLTDGDLVDVRLALGSFTATVTGTTPPPADHTRPTPNGATA